MHSEPCITITTRKDSIRKVLSNDDNDDDDAGGGGGVLHECAIVQVTQHGLFTIDMYSVATGLTSLIIISKLQSTQKVVIGCNTNTIQIVTRWH